MVREVDVFVQEPVDDEETVGPERSKKGLININILSRNTEQTFIRKYGAGVFLH